MSRELWQLLALYLAAANLAAFILMGADKSRARRGRWRISEKALFLPALLGVFCGWQWRLEHADHNWNSFLTAPVPVGALYAAKLILAAGVSLLAQGWIGGLYLLSGKLAGLSGSLPPELPGWLLLERWGVSRSVPSSSFSAW